MENNINLGEYYFKTPFEYAIETRNLNAIQHLIGNNAVINYQELNRLIEISKQDPHSFSTSILMSMLYGAITAKRMALMELLLTHIPKQAIVRDSSLLLTIFCTQPKFSIDLYNRTQNNYFILKEIIKLLLDNGLDVTATAKNTDSNILHVLSEFQIPFENYVLSSQVNIDKPDYFGQTPLIRSATTCNFKIMEYLINQGANVKSKDLGENTALHFLMANRAHQLKPTAKMITLLLDKGADPYAKNSIDMAPLDYLFKNCFSRECFLAFYLYGVKFDFTDATLRYKLTRKVQFFKVKTSNKIEMLERLFFKLIFLKEFDKEEKSEGIKKAKINIIEELTAEPLKIFDKLSNRKISKPSEPKLEYLNLLDPLRNINNVSDFLKERYRQILQANIDKLPDTTKELYSKLLNFIDEISPKIKNNLKRIGKETSDSLNHKLQLEDNDRNSKNLLTKLAPFGKPITNMINFLKGNDIENLLLAIQHSEESKGVKQNNKQSNKRIKLSEDNKYSKIICTSSDWSYTNPFSENSSPINTDYCQNLEVIGSNKFSHLDGASFFSF